MRSPGRNNAQMPNGRGGGGGDGGGGGGSGGVGCMAATAALTEAASKPLSRNAGNSKGASKGRKSVGPDGSAGGGICIGWTTTLVLANEAIAALVGYNFFLALEFLLSGRFEELIENDP
jgi:hypothetical protein